MTKARWKHLLMGIALAVPPGIPAQTLEQPHADYILHCRGCHLADGQGVHGRVPALNSRLGEMIQLDGGRAYLIQVPGAAQSELSNGRLAAVTNWLLEHFAADSVAEGFAPYTAEEVKRYRENRPLDISAKRRQLLTQLQRMKPARDAMRAAE